MATVDEADETVGVPEADQLYEVTPDGFVGARDALVRELKAQKRKDDAAAVGALRRPTPGAFALNQVARRQDDLVEQALAATEELNRATDQALAGDTGALRTAQQTQRRTADAVVRAALSVLRQHGLRAPDEVRQRMLDTLRAAAADEEVAAQLRAGRLRVDHEAPGFAIGGIDLGAFATTTTGGAAKAPTRAKPVAARKASDAGAPGRADDADALAARRAELVEALTARQRDAAGLAEQADAAAAEARQAVEAHEAAAAEADAARRAADEASQLAAHAADDAKAANERAARAAEAADDARAAVEVAQAELDATEASPPKR